MYRGPGMGTHGTHGCVRDGGSIALGSRVGARGITGRTRDVQGKENPQCGMRKGVKVM